MQGLAYILQVADQLWQVCPTPEGCLRVLMHHVVLIAVTVQLRWRVLNTLEKSFDFAGKTMQAPKQ